jgi:hypothetical protein
MSTLSVDALKVGPPTGQATGTYIPRRAGAFAEGIVQQAHGKYYEAASRGTVFSAQTGSGKRLAVLKLGMGYVSGTLGAGVVHVCSSAAADAAPTGTAITPRNRNVGGSATSVATPFTTATITTNAGKVISVLCSLGASLATTAVQPWDVEKDFDGEIVIEPGYNITIHATAAAGTSPLVVFNALWEEVSTVS